MRAATADAWKRTPFGELVTIPYRSRFSADEFERLKLGLIPRAMEDKWFIYFAESTLFLHRSWTGMGVFKVSLSQEGSQAEVADAQYDAQVLSASDADYQVRLLGFLISNLLLGKQEPFPIPAGIDEPAPGVYQHAISGTGYAERAVPAKRRWWRLGR